MKFTIAILKILAMRFHEGENLPEFMSGKSVVISEADRIKPKFGFMVAFFHVNVRGLVAFMRIEMKPVAAFSQYRRHTSFLSRLLEITRTA
jgi:hypothetical protein